MRNQRAKNLQLAGIELVLPTVLCIDGRQSKAARTLTIGYATGYVDTIVGPLVAEWLSRHFHWHFNEHGRGPEGDLAAEAFYDMLANHFKRGAPFLAAIVSQPHNVSQRHGNGNVLSRFMSGAGLARWTFDGAVRAFINPKTGAAQVAFEPLPGGIELTSADKSDLPGTKLGKRANAAFAWYGFGVPLRDPADIVLMLRNDIGASRHAHAHARRAAHA
ncbi:MAG: hypothetical protein J2P55_04475 [Rhizobiales bacterium]|nr:hypothetical protein [Hyphomicrobiales bacterium]